MPEEFVEELRRRVRHIDAKVTAQKIWILSSAIVVLVALIGHAWYASGKYTEVRTNGENNSKHLESLTVTVRGIEREQIARGNQAKQIETLGVDIREMHLMLREVRDDVIEMKSQQKVSSK